MMNSLGHEVIHYGAENSEVSEWAEDVVVLSAKEQEGWFGPFDINKLYSADWTGKAEYWKLLNERSASEIKKRQRKGDFVCVIMGRLNQPIVQLLDKDVLTVEYGIGYNGPFANYRVFESYAHMHKIWGAQGGFDPDGHLYDVVIPNYLDPDEYTYKAEKQDYYLYLGRMVRRKGLEIAVETTRRIGAQLIMAGQGAKQEGNKITCSDGSTYTGDHIQYVGPVIGKERDALLQNAKAAFVPTLYIEPFGTVAVEAQMCGTPVITTDFGVFPETVEHGKTGFRCHTLDQFIWAAKHIGEIDTWYTHQRTMANYSMDRVRYKYQEYFEMLSDLHGKGWYEVHEDRKNLDWLRFYP
jgi:glycosyltransferase involved in cell wall biosynthesis